MGAVIVATRRSASTHGKAKRILSIKNQPPFQTGNVLLESKSNRNLCSRSKLYYSNISNSIYHSNSFGLEYAYYVVIKAIVDHI